MRLHSLVTCMKDMYDKECTTHWYSQEVCIFLAHCSSKGLSLGPRQWSLLHMHLLACQLSKLLQHLLCCMALLHFASCVAHQVVWCPYQQARRVNDLSSANSDTTATCNSDATAVKLARLLLEGWQCVAQMHSCQSNQPLLCGLDDTCCGRRGITPQYDNAKQLRQNTQHSTAQHSTSQLTCAAASFPPTLAKKSLSPLLGVMR